MIQLLPVNGDPIDMTGHDWLRVQGRCAELNAEGKLVVIGFGGAPALLARKGEFFRLSKVPHAEFRKTIEQAEKHGFQNLWDCEGECAA